MLSILYPIKNRLHLFEPTLKSIIAYADDIRDQFEIIVLDSGSEDGIKNFCINNKKQLDIKYVLYKYPGLMEEHNPAYAFNLGANLSKNGAIVLTSPEVVHITPVIKQLISLIGKNIICKIDDEGPNGEMRKSVSLEYRADNPGLYFIGMYSKNDYFSIGGIDEKMMLGMAFEDTDFGMRFKRAGLKYEVRDEIVGLHKWHPRPSRVHYESWKINRKRFTKNVANKIIKVNLQYKLGDTKYIKEII